MRIMQHLLKAILCTKKDVNLFLNIYQWSTRITRTISFTTVISTCTDVCQHWTNIEELTGRPICICCSTGVCIHVWYCSLFHMIQKRKFQFYLVLAGEEKKFLLCILSFLLYLKYKITQYHKQKKFITILPDGLDYPLLYPTRS